MFEKRCVHSLIKTIFILSTCKPSHRWVASWPQY